MIPSTSASAKARSVVVRRFPSAPRARSKAVIDGSAGARAGLVDAEDPVVSSRIANCIRASATWTIAYPPGTHRVPHAWLVA